MQPVFIDCHGFRQFHKVLNALYSPDLDLGRFISDLEVTEVQINKISYSLFTIQVLPADPMFNGSHCYLHEYLMDTLPTPARFITCMDYEEIFDPEYKGMHG